MGLYGLQRGVTERHAGRLLAASSSALSGRHRRCSSRQASRPPSLGRVHFSTESRQHALGDFQLIELIVEPCPFGVEPREPLGNLLLLRSNLVHRSHPLSPSSSPEYRG